MPFRLKRVRAIAGIARRAILPIAASLAVVAGASAAFGEDQRLFVMNADGAELRPLTDLPDLTAQGSPEFSPDGERIVFDGWRAGQGETLTDARIFVVNADGTGPKDLGEGCLPSFSPDGKSIAFSRYDTREQAWLMDADGKNRRPIAGGGWSVTWSPVENEVASTVGGNLVVSDPAGGTGRRLIRAADVKGQVFWNFGWSPDGKSICYTRSTGRENERELCVVSAEGSDNPVRALWSGNLANAVAWHSDGNRIVVSRHDPGLGRTQIFTVAATEDAPEPVRLDAQDRRSANGDAVVSRDGERWVFRRTGPWPPEGAAGPFRLDP